LFYLTGISFRFSKIVGQQPFYTWLRNKKVTALRIFCKCFFTQATRAVVIINWSKFSPPNVQELTCGTGTSILCNKAPVAGFHRHTQKPSHCATQSMPSSSMVMPSGKPISSGIVTTVRSNVMVPCGHQTYSSTLARAVNKIKIACHQATRPCRCYGKPRKLPGYRTPFHQCNKASRHFPLHSGAWCPAKAFLAVAFAIIGTVVLFALFL
jgi:hypothetical protein